LATTEQALPSQLVSRCSPAAGVDAAEALRLCCGEASPEDIHYPGRWLMSPPKNTT
jgi:hypothetical protein